MPVIQDQELLYTLLSEGRLDLMFLPAGAIAWLWKDERPEEQIAAATQLGVAAKDINPIVSASILKADKNILILKCEDGQAFRVYPGGGYSHGGEEMMDLHGAIEAMQNIPEGEMQEPDVPCGGDMMDAVTGIVDVVMAPDDGFDHMAAPQPPEEVMSGGPINLEDLLRRADNIDMNEGTYGDQPRFGQYYTFDELASETARDIEAHSGEDLDDGCSQNLEGQEFCGDGGLPNDPKRVEKFNFKDDVAVENVGGSAAPSAPAGSDVYDTEDDMAGGVMMQFEDEGERDNVAFLKAMKPEEMNDVLKQMLDAVAWQADKDAKSQLRGLKVRDLVRNDKQRVINDWVDAGALFPVISGFHNTAAGEYQHQGEEFSKWLHEYTGDGNDFEKHQKFRSAHPNQWKEYVARYLAAD